MLYTVNTDINNYVLSLSHTDHDNIELDITKIDTKYLTAYQLIGNSMMLDEVKKAELIYQEEQTAKAERIAELKKYMTDTDYITARTVEDIMSLSNPLTFVTDVIAILVKYATQYKDIIAQRKIVRAEIEELEK